MDESDIDRVYGLMLDENWEYLLFTACCFAIDDRNFKELSIEWKEGHKDKIILETFQKLLKTFGHERRK